ncbi:GxxExxY protein [bacterium]|nr:GxxExxY protein [bacterium]
MDENGLAKMIIHKAFQIHKDIGPGLLETVYEVILAKELENEGLNVSVQQPISVKYKKYIFEQGFRADIVVNDCVIIELKSIEKIAPVHKKQLLTYLRLSHKKLGLLINFGEHLIKDGMHRVVNGL